MSNKLIAFLGTGKYELTEYVWGDKTKTCQYSMVATASFVEAKQVIVFATQEAREAHEPPLREAMPGASQLTIIEIPKGEKQEELWKIFSTVAGEVQEKDKLSFDITHGLRSFPVIGVLAAAFLRRAPGIELKAILYGAYDTRDGSVDPPRTQIFDLTPLLTLLEWAIAADRFNKTGDSRYFADLLRDEKARLAKQAQNKPDRCAHLTNLAKLSKILTEISKSLALIRPHLAMQKIAELSPQMNKTLPVVEKEIKPFELVFDTVLSTYKNLSLAEPTTDARKDLECQRSMIEWYVEREHWVQAISLAREWLLSWIMYHLKLDSFTDPAERKRIEKAVNSEAAKRIKSAPDDAESTPVDLKTIPQLKSVLGLWSSIADVRNDIDHAAMRPTPWEPDSLIRSIKSNLEKIKNLPLER